MTAGIARRIQSDPDVCGFPGQMLGAYLAGLVATGDASRVTLHRPVSGGSELWVEGTAALATIRCDSEVVATVEEWDPADIAVPQFVAPVDVDGVAVFDPERHPVPGCFSCAVPARKAPGCGSTSVFRRAERWSARAGGLRMSRLRMR